MNTYCIENLSEIKSLCERLAPNHYTKPLEILSGSSIGQHIRHIIELYQAVEKSGPAAIINYDNRKRNLIIETSPHTASMEIQLLLDFLSGINWDKNLTLQGDFGKCEDLPLEIKTSLFRELAYNLEHAIHHQALIKIGLIQLGLVQLIDSDFGVASATIRFRKSQLVLQES